MSKWGLVRKKPVIVNFREVEKKTLIRVIHEEGKNTEVWGEEIATQEGTMVGYVGLDYIIKGIQGEEYPIKKENFYHTYEIVQEPTNTVQYACDDDVSKWALPGHVGCSSRTEDGMCAQIDDAHCIYQKRRVR